jgi:hypothetical protein
MKLPWLFICGGTIGSLKPPVFDSIQNSSSFAGTQIGGGLSRQPGSSSSSGPGSITAPDRMCAPMVEDFSITHTDSLGLELLEADGEGQAGRAGADREHVVFHDIAFAHACSDRAGSYK